MPFSAAANILADKIGAKNAWRLDLEAACNKFVTEFLRPHNSLSLENIKKKLLLVVGGDKMSSIIDYKQDHLHHFER